MYKLIIVDDEIGTRNDVAELLKIHGDGFEITGLFDDGVSAKEYIDNNDVNVVITDIKMPCMDGLELSEYLHREHPDIVIIIISGYSEFEYARRSMEYNVKRYVLKPINIKEIINLLREIKNELDTKKNISSGYTEWEIERQRGFLSRLYLGFISDEKQMLDELKELHLKYDIYGINGSVLNITFENYTDFLDTYWKHGKERVFVALENIFADLYGNHISCCLFQNGNEITAIVFCDNLEEEKLIKGVRELLNAQIDVSVATSFSSLIGVKSNIINKTYIQEFVIRVVTELCAKEIGCVKKVLKDCADRISKQKNASEMENELKAKLISALSLYYDTTMIKNISISDLVENFDKYIYRMSDSKKEADEVIERAKEFMRENYERDISVSDISQSVYLSAEYFGRYYKKITGQSVNMFLVELRMKKAIEYLRQGCLVKEISEKVGYADYRYFLRVFKRYTGYSPNAYKKKYGLDS